MCYCPYRCDRRQNTGWTLHLKSSLLLWQYNTRDSSDWAARCCPLHSRPFPLSCRVNGSRCRVKSTALFEAGWELEHFGLFLHTLISTAAQTLFICVWLLSSSCVLRTAPHMETWRPSHTEVCLHPGLSDHHTLHFLLFFITSCCKYNLE